VSEGYAIATRELARAKVMRKHRGNVVLAEQAEARLSELLNRPGFTGGLVP
jgi:hypothetical protein